VFPSSSNLDTSKSKYGQVFLSCCSVATTLRQQIIFNNTGSRRSPGHFGLAGVKPRMRCGQLIDIYVAAACILGGTFHIWYWIPDICVGYLPSRFVNGNISNGSPYCCDEFLKVRDVLRSRRRVGRPEVLIRIITGAWRSEFRLSLFCKGEGGEPLFGSICATIVQPEFQRFTLAMDAHHHRQRRESYGSGVRSLAR